MRPTRTTRKGNALRSLGGLPVGGTPVKFTQHRRLDKLRDVLARHPRGVTLYELSDLLQVAPRTMRRYLKEIEREFELMPVRPRGGGPSLWRIRPSELPRKVEMRRAQAYALLATRRIFEPLKGSALYDEIELAVAKLMAFAERPGRGPNAGRANTQLADRFLYLPTVVKDYSDKAEAVDELFQAVLELRQITFKHKAKESNREERVTLNPCGLVLHADEVYCVGLVAGDEDSAEEVCETYSLDRMRDVRTVADRPFVLPADFRLEEQFNGPCGPHREGATTPVVVEVQAPLARKLRVSQVHPSQRVTAMAGGISQFKLTVEQPLALLPKILAWGASARVIAPPELVAAVADELRRSLAQYQD